MSELVKEYQRLISDFEKIPQLPKLPPTFMELSGYPHYENVCSNILCFFFDTSKQHQLNNLFLKSILECCGNPHLAETITTTENVYREEATFNKKRIDIVIEAEDTVVVIENKIFHSPINPFEEYQNHVNLKLPTLANKFFIVLSIRPETKLPSPFINVTYHAFFKQVKANIGEFFINGHTRYITYLADFIESVENHYKIKPMNLEMFKFVSENEAKIEELNSLRKEWINKLHEKVLEISGKINFEDKSVNRWIWEKYVLVFDFTFTNDVVVAMDISVDWNTLGVELFVRKGNVDKIEFLDSLPLIKNSTSKNRGDRGYLLEWKQLPFYKINSDEVAKQIEGYLHEILS